MLDSLIRIPNFGLIIFYLTFIILLPILFYNYNIFLRDILPIYTVILLGLSATLTASGYPYIFQNLYPNEPKNNLGWISKNIISLFCIMGILLSIENFNSYKSKIYILLKILLMILTSIICLPKIINIVIDKMDILMETKKREFKFNIHKFFAGLIVLILVVIVNYFILKM